MAKSRKGKGSRPNAKGRSEAERYIKITHWLWDNPAVRSLSGQAIKVWVHLIYQYNGFNNGEISMSVRQLEAEIGICKNTASKVLIELHRHGLIVTTEKGRFRGRMASTYRLTHLPWNECLPTHDYKNWCPQSGRLIVS